MTGTTHKAICNSEISILKQLMKNWSLWERSTLEKDFMKDCIPWEGFPHAKAREKHEGKTKPYELTTNPISCPPEPFRGRRLKNQE